MGIFDKFKSGLGKSSSSFSEGFKNIFSKKKVDSTILEEFEELIISSDAGVDVAKELRKDFENFKVDKKLEDHKEILKLLADKLAINLQKYEKDLSLMGNAKSAVIVVSGVNGVGKTTSIGKLGKYFKDNNRSVVFGAADTFRAAAIDQLQVWAAKVKVDIIKSLCDQVCNPVLWEKTITKMFENKISNYVEIGPGKGAITEQLASRVDTTHAVEIDKELSYKLRELEDEKNFYALLINSIDKKIMLIKVVNGKQVPSWSSLGELNLPKNL